MGMDPNQYHMDPNMMYQTHNQPYGNYIFQQSQGNKQFKAQNIYLTSKPGTRTNPDTETMVWSSETVVWSSYIFDVNRLIRVLLKGTLQQICSRKLWKQQ